MGCSVCEAQIEWCEQSFLEDEYSSGAVKGKAGSRDETQTKTHPPQTRREKDEKDLSKARRTDSHGRQSRALLEMKVYFIIWFHNIITFFGGRFLRQTQERVGGEQTL